MPFSGFDDRVAELRGTIAEAVRRGGYGQDVRLIAVTKTYGADAVEAAWLAGIRGGGGEKVQGGVGKQPAVSGAATAMGWHLIGHLQRNKVKFLDRFTLFHALDSARLADAVHEFGERRGAAVDALLQVNVAGGETKGGFEPSEIGKEAERLRPLAGVRLIGVMTMAPFGAGEAMLRRVFAGARAARASPAVAGHPARELSMGMSSDYEVAVEEGATMVRVGTILFGTRAT